MARRRSAGNPAIKPQKLYRLRRWRMDTPTGPAYLFTCGRPGREKSKNLAVPDDLVHRWVLGLRGPNTAIVSLLGRKPDGTSEYSFYSFCGGCDTEAERGNRQTFQEWLETHHSSLGILVREHPTTDYGPIHLDTLDVVADDIRRLISQGYTVTIVDSGGETRTGKVCSYIGAKEDSSGNV